MVRARALQTCGRKTSEETVNSANDVWLTWAIGREVHENSGGLLEKSRAVLLAVMDSRCRNVNARSHSMSPKKRPPLARALSRTSRNQS